MTVESKKNYQTASGDIAYWICKASDGAPWLVFLPGTAVDHRVFRNQIEYFEGKFNVLYWDAPSHGESRPFQTTWSLDDMANWLHGILECEGISRPILVGHSLGGCIAQAYVDLYPGTVGGFISVDSLPLERSYSTGFQRWMFKHIMSMFKPMPYNALVKQLINNNAVTEDGKKLMGTMMAQYDKQELLSVSDQSFRGIAASMGDDRAYKFDCPTLLILGENDAAYAVPGYNKQMAKREGYPLKMIPNAGHNSGSDNPAAVNAAMEGFLKQQHMLD